MNRTLIFSSIGDYEQKNWIELRDENIDFVFSYYGKNDKKFEILSKIAIYCFRSRGVKFQFLWSYWIHNREFIMKTYDIVGVIDDDLQFSSEIMKNFLDKIREHMKINDQNVVYSPSHDPKGKISHQHMKQQFGERFRKVMKIEMSFPFFKTSFLDSYLMEYYEPSLLGYGEGRLYSEKANSEKKNLYIVDDFPTINPTNEQKQLLYNEMSHNYPHYAEIWKIIAKFKNIK